MDKRKDLIDLQNAHVTQLTDKDGEKTEWMVRQNETSNDLDTLPKDWSEATVFKALDFARKFELIALNEGINFGVKKVMHDFDQERQAFRKVIADLAAANDRLANKLGNLLGEQEEY